MRFLVEANQKRLIKKASNTQKRASHANSSGILSFSSLKQAMINEEASQPQHQDSALDHWWFSNHMCEEWDSIIDIGLHQAYKLDFTLLLER